MSLSQVLYPRVTIVKQMLEIASHSPPYRDNCHLKALSIQAPDNMNRHPLCAAGAQHRKDMNDSNLLHDFVRRPAGESFMQRKARDPEPAVSGDHGRSKTAARCLGAGERHQHGKATSGLHRRTGQSIGRKRTTSVYASPRSDLTLLSPKLSSIQSILSAEWVGGPSGSSPKLPALRRKLRSPGCPAPQVPKEKYCAQEAPASPRHQGEWVPPRLG